MNEITCPYCGAEKMIGCLCPECGRSGRKVSSIAYLSDCGFQEMKADDFDKAQDQVASIINAGCFLLWIKETEVRK